MGFAATVVLVGVVVALAVVAWGTFAKKRYIAVALVALAVTGLAALLGYYSAVETQSMAWAIGYGVVAFVAAVVAGRHLVGRP